jgi:hypothetical protein
MLSPKQTAYNPRTDLTKNLHAVLSGTTKYSNTQVYNEPQRTNSELHTSVPSQQAHRLATTVLKTDTITFFVFGGGGGR